MNVDGSQMIKGLHYEETYAPVVQWATIRFFLTLAIISKWHTRQLDFVLAYTQVHETTSRIHSTWENDN
jgi:hypothetical protein